MVVPQGWTVLSTQTQSQPTTASGTKEFQEQVAQFGLNEKDLAKWFDDEPLSGFQFGLSPVISVYLYSVMAGPYVKIDSDKDEIKNYRFPLSLYCRRSLQKFVERAKEEYFNVTKCGIDYYEKLFSTPYPFAKLD